MQNEATVTAILRRLNDFNLQDFDPPELKKKFVVSFPEKIENYVASFDDKLMYWSQRVVTGRCTQDPMINGCLIFPISRS